MFFCNPNGGSRFHPVPCTPYPLKKLPTFFQGVRGIVWGKEKINKFYC
jgi:hypothetical protein